MPAKTVIVLPAFNAERTLERTLAAIPAGVAHELIVVDDGSTDRTVEICRRLPVTLICHPSNRGYGGNQKTCYDAALACGADYVVLLHPDDQYDARLIPAAVEVLRLGVCDVVLGNRVRTRAEALAGGMPKVKYAANRALTLVENVLAGQNLGEWHSGFRAYRRQVLDHVPYHRNADGFVFDSQFLVQCVHFGFKLGDIPMPVRYFEGMSSIGLKPATGYAFATLRTFLSWYLHRLHLRQSDLFAPAEPKSKE